jgi:hypothetical protein
MDASQKDKWLINNIKNAQHPQHNGNANQNYTETLSHPSQNGSHQENK